MGRYAVEYWETYSQIFYVEAPNAETALKRVEHEINEAPELIEKIEMDSSGYKDVTNASITNMSKEEWDRDVDFKEEFYKEDYVLVNHKVYQDEKERLNNLLQDEAQELGLDRDTLFLQNLNNSNSVIKMGVNWSSFGTVEPTRTEAFLTLLNKANEIAKEFKYNGYKEIWP